jgi:hypothetical protein
MAAAVVACSANEMANHGPLGQQSERNPMFHPRIQGHNTSVVLGKGSCKKIKVIDFTQPRSGDLVCVRHM